MLLGIDPRLTSNLLATLMDMGHGDDLAVVDTHFPAKSTAAATVSGRCHDLSGISAPDAIAAITSLLPLDAFSPHCAWRMEIDGDPAGLGEVHTEAFALLEARLPEGTALGSIERQDYYRRARTCFAVVKTGETRPYGCFILRKGVVL